MKKLFALLSILLTFSLVFSLTGCENEAVSSDTTPPANSGNYTAIDMSVACLQGPTGVGMAKLMEDSAKKKTANNYTFTVTSAPDEITGKFLKGEINIASLPTNVAAKLHAKNADKVTMLAVNTLGVLSILENGESIKSVADLKGKTIYSTGEGSNPEFILKYILKENKIDPETDVTINFVANNQELNAALISGKATVAMVPEPAATTVLNKKNTLKRVLSINDEWEKVSESKLMMGCVVALKSFVEENPKQVEKFLSEYEASVKFAKESIDYASELCEKYEIVTEAAIAKKAIPNCNLTYVLGKDAKNDISGYFEVLFDFDKESIGGALPQDTFYYGK